MQNETKVDVLDAMDNAALCLPLREDRNDMRQARAAVAELIEADREYDEATFNLTTMSEGGACYSPEAERRFDLARDRRAAAIARIGGAA